MLQNWKIPTAILACALTLGSFDARADEGPLSFQLTIIPATNESPTKISVPNIPKTLLSKIERREVEVENLLTVHVVDEAASDSSQSVPAISGKVSIVDGSLVFEPRYPFRPGQLYRARFAASLVSASSPDIQIPFRLAAIEPTSKPKVSAVYPSAKVLPENHFRFYIHFATPMARGEAYRHLSLRYEDGSPDGIEVPAAILEIGEELWDRSGTRFTVYLDPGRVKRALVPRQEDGPILVPSKRYSLVVHSGWQDASGQPLDQTFKHTFTVGPAQHDTINVKSWKVSSIKRGSREPLTIHFPITLDRAMLQRTIHVVGSNGRENDGDISIGPEEKSWTFTPQEAWTSGPYQLLVEPALEDSAGNNLFVPLESESSASHERRPTPREPVILEVRVN